MASQIPYPDRFFAAAKLGKAPLHEGHDLSDDIRLFLYGLYRQGHEGRCTEPRPSIWSGDAVAVAKWMAWNKMSSMNKMEAMFKYVQFLEEEIPTLWDAYQPEVDEDSGPELPAIPKRKRGEPGEDPEGEMEDSRSAPEKAESSAEIDKGPPESASDSKPVANGSSEAAPTAISESSEVQTTETPLQETPSTAVAPGEEKAEEAAQEVSQPALTAQPPAAQPQVSAKQGMPYPEKFYEAARRGQAPMHEDLGLGNDVRLFLYGLYQQGSLGPCTASRCAFLPHLHRHSLRAGLPGALHGLPACFFTHPRPHPCLAAEAPSGLSGLTLRYPSLPGLPCFVQADYPRGLHGQMACLPPPIPTVSIHIHHDTRVPMRTRCGAKASALVQVWRMLAAARVDIEYWCTLSTVSAWRTSAAAEVWRTLSELG
ncbi:hypothetical protein CYMTET_46217 [Cymbomonas tetramitiformis]|uniref:ACB domain-containing protein n=1 Tax=Cymbomonas tetramitiformis TaxID=36881 RepID=A0AAE0BYG6_9CHLO|nr:hypothetical protein CYMTET_46217 [Cymbomonas tetramitiformis]